MAKKRAEPKPKPLNARQEQVRRRLVETRGIINNAALGRELGVSRQQIMRDRRLINLVDPAVVDWDEEEEIGKALEFYASQEAACLDELEFLEAEVEKRGGQKSVTGLMANRINLLREIRQNRQARDDFLIQIGYFKAAPSRLLLGRDQIEDIEGDALDQEIDKLEQILGDKKGKRQPAK